MDAKQLAWAYVFTNGGVVLTHSFNSWNTYIGNFEFCDEYTKLCVKEILDFGIDWDKTKEPSDGQQPKFQGTFDDSVFVDTMTGELFLNGGMSYIWSCNFETSKNVFEIVSEFYKLDSIEEILKKTISDEDT